MSIDESVLSKRSMDEIAGDAGSAEWKSSRPAGAGKLKAAWLADAVAKLDKKKAANKRLQKTQKKKHSRTRETRVKHRCSPEKSASSAQDSKRDQKTRPKSTRNPPCPLCLAVKALQGPVKRPMPTAIHPMLAESIEKPFDGEDWLFEIKWDGYRAIAFIENGKVRLVSRNQNDLTARYPELKDMAQFIKAKTAILDGEVVALDEEGQASFSLMQQRTGFRPDGKRAAANADVPVLYYAFDLLYLDGYDWRRVPLEERKRKLASLILQPGDGAALLRSLRGARQGAVRHGANRRGWKALSPRAAPVATKNAAAASG